MQERLQKILARAGVASRRAAEDLIEQGRVTVNGTTITELGSRADPETDHIKVDGKRISMPSQHVYLLLNKPKGVMSTVSDPEGRPVVTDLIKGVKGRIYPVGRLDFQSEGALMLTNDGDLMNTLLAARSKCHKTYLVKVSGIPDAKNLGRLERGVTIEGLRYSGCEITLFDTPKNAWLRVVLYEGKKQHLRKIFDHIGHSVTKLKRISFAGLELDDLEAGQFRHLTNEEVAQLKSGKYAPPPSGMKELDKAGVPVKKPEYRADRRPIRGRKPAASGPPRPRTGPSSDRPKSGPRGEGSSSADRPRAARTAQGKDSRSSRPRPERDSQARDSRPSRPRSERDSQARDSRPSRPRSERDSQARDSRPSRPRSERDSQARDSRPGDARKTRSSDSRTRRDQPAPGKPRSRSGSGGSSTSRSGRPSGGSRSQSKQGSRGGFGGSRGGKGGGPKGGGQGGGRRGGGHRG